MLDAIAEKSLIVGLARDLEHQVGDEFAKLTQAFDPHQKAHWLVIESDSSDGTVEALRRLAAERPRFRYLSLGRLTRDYPSRTARIAFCRNAYLAELESHADYADIEYLVVADLDNVNTEISAASLATCFTRTDWGACSANRRGPYYDIWALRHPDWSPNDCWRQYRFLLAMGLSPYRALNIAIHDRMITIPPQAEWVEVDSAFGGFCLYKRTALRGARYVGLTEEGEEICEHVSFHRQIQANGAKQYINPKLITGSLTQYTRGLRWRSRIKAAALASVSYLRSRRLPARQSWPSLERDDMTRLALMILGFPLVAWLVYRDNQAALFERRRTEDYARKARS